MSPRKRNRLGARKKPEGKSERMMMPCRNTSVHVAHDWKQGGKGRRCPGIQRYDAQADKPCAGKGPHVPHPWDGGQYRCPGIRKTK